MFRPASFFARTRFVATSRMSDGARSTRCWKRSWSLASSTRFESMAATTSSSFSCDVTTIQHGRRRFAGLEQVLADLAELLDGGPQVFDLVAAAGDVLAHFVDDEDERLARPAPAPKLEGPLDDLADGDGGRLLRCDATRVRRGIGLRVELVQDCTGSGELLRTLRTAASPACAAVAGRDEFVELALGFEFDLQFGDVEVLGVVEFPQQRRCTSTRRSAP